MARQQLDGFLIPRTDEFQNEYVPPCNERLHWLTGFTGSAGFAVVLATEAALFVDGRYTLQAGQEVDPADWQVVPMAEQSAAGWLSGRLGTGQKLGYCPVVMTQQTLGPFREFSGKAGLGLVPVMLHPVDALWGDERPAPPSSKVEIHPLEFAGQDWQEKVAHLRLQLAQEQADAVLVTDPASLCWLLNVRGRDVPYTPLLLANALVPAEGAVTVYCDPLRVDASVQGNFGKNVVWKAPAHLLADLQGLEGKKIWIDAATCSLAFTESVPGAVSGENPLLLPKSCKNPVERQGARNAHARDGRAVTAFLDWLAQQETVTEVQAADRLDGFRQQQPLFVEPSFPTISGSGPNGAIVHYRATAGTDRRLQAGELYLVDSGGQYRDGTTDVTRTVFVGPGEPTATMKSHFTRVLKGHIALATARFPRGTTGAQLDVLARYWLWQAGLDYAHGTGHGVGSFLSVHEGPQGISSRASRAALQPGMILSNEPGYYLPGQYGIRIENLVLVRDDLPQPEGADAQMLGFETLTLVPIDMRLVEMALLTQQEKEWLESYHQRVTQNMGDVSPQ